MWPFTASYPECRAEDLDGKTYDYIIVGGGTAGCVLASRLSEDPGVTLLVVEKGHVRDHWMSRVPMLSMNYFFPWLQAMFDYSEPVPQPGGRKLRIVSAHALGGSSRINAMLYTRGAPGGYNEWAETLGLEDWSWDKVEPYFKSVENATAHPDDPSRGHDGPLELTQSPATFAFYAYLEKACKALGLPTRQDCNSPTAPVQAHCNADAAIDKHNQRLSVYRAFLNKSIALQRKDRLTVCTGTVASKLELNARTGTVTGVLLRSTTEKSSQERIVKAKREVVVCNGAMRTPQLLMLSGIGPKDQLQKHGIPLVCDLPVGQHLKDHTGFSIMVEVPLFETLHMLERALTAIWQLILYVFAGCGIMGSTFTPQTIFLRSTALDEKSAVKAREPDGTDNMDASLPRNIPDVEIMVIPRRCIDEDTPGKSLLSFLATLTQPISEGSVELASTDAKDSPRIHYPFFTDTRDLVTARKAARFTMRLAQELHNSGYPHGAPVSFAPGVNKILPPLREDSEEQVEKTWDTVTDDEIDQFVLGSSISCLHLACTCRMALDPKDGVVDQKLRVHGWKNLRIADASVFPKIPSVHTMAPTIVIGARCADFIKAKWNGRGRG